MAKAKKAKRGGAIVMYIRVKIADHAQISKIAKKLGCTIASVAAALISQRLESEHLAGDTSRIGDLIDAEASRQVAAELTRPPKAVT